MVKQVPQGAMLYERRIGTPCRESLGIVCLVGYEREGEGEG